jgi:hypothetical protein
MSKALAWLGGVIATAALLAFMTVAASVPSKVAKPEFVKGQTLKIPVTFGGKTFFIEGTVESVRSSDDEPQTSNTDAKRDRLTPAALKSQHIYRGPYYGMFAWIG